MVLYGISDLHLSFMCDKPMDVFKGWQHHDERIKANWCRIVKQDDIVVLPGDFSWALKLEDTLEDFKFLESLPGKKLILKGNHDLWWSTAKKINDFFNENNINSVQIVFNNCYPVGEYAVCGTRGWIKEKEADNLILAREAGRLRASLDSAINLGLKPIVFLHYPVVHGSEVNEPIMQVLKEYGITKIYHGHIHGGGFASVVKEYDGITQKLISCDGIDFTPYPILEIKV